MNDVNDMGNSKTNLNNPFTALKHKNFRYYWIGMCVSLIGSWMQNMAQPWLAYKLTQSPLLLGLIGVFQFTPVLLLSLFAGVIIDKFSKKKILIFTQSASLIITLILAILVWTGVVQYWHILLMATALGIVNTLDMPTRQSLVIELVGKEDLTNAVALNSSVFNLARIIGPAIAGVIMASFGTAYCFFINSISFGAVLISLFFIKPMETNIIRGEKSDIIEDIKDGLKYVYKHKIILNIMFVILIVSTFAMNLNVLVPVFAKVVLKQEETGFGILMSSVGFGSFLGAMMIASISKSNNRRFMTEIMPLIISLILIIGGFTSDFLFASITLAILGFCFVAFSSTANSAIQMDVEDEYRGRVMSIYYLVFAGCTPIGSLFAGTLAQHYGPQIAFMVSGVVVVILMSATWIYKKRVIKIK